MRNFIALDIGGTNIKYGIVNDIGEVIKKSEIATEAQKGPVELLSKITRIIEVLLKENNDISGIGISTAGVVDTEKGSILYANNNLPGYTGTNLKEIIEEKFNIRTIVNNDVNSAAMAEQWVGAGKNRKTFFCMTIGTGIGGAIVIDGKLYKGVNFRAAEIGYLNKVNAEVYYEKMASTSALISKVKKELNIEDNIDGKSIFEKVKAGDETYNKIYSQWIDEICKGMSNIIYLFDPGLIIIGGGVSKQKEFFIDSIRKSISKYLPEEFLEGTSIEVALCGNDAGMIGAVYEYNSYGFKSEA